MSDLLAALKFCAGSVAKKDIIPALTHFAIEHNTVRGFNGVIAISSPIPFDIACKPKADMLIKAIANCKDTVSMHLTQAGRLSVRSAGFKVLVDCIQEDTPHAKPEGQMHSLERVKLLPILEALAPFMGDDASRKWSNGILFADQSFFATNNVTLVQYWLGLAFPFQFVIPREAVREMLRIGENPIKMQVDAHSISFHYEGDRWLRTQLYDHTQWPDLGRILNTPSNQTVIEPAIFEALAVLKPFVDGQGSVYFQPGRLTTHLDEEQGAAFEIPGFAVEGRFNIDMLGLLAGVVKSIDWNSYPKPCMFQGEMIRGAIVGMRR